MQQCLILVVLNIMLNKHKVAIIGYGWLGKSLANRLIHQGFLVHSGSRSTLEINKDGGLTLFSFQFHENKLQVSDSFWDIDTLVVCVPPGQERSSYPELIRNLIEQTKFHQIDSILFTSSTSVYQDLDGQMNEESEALNEGILLESERMVLQSGCTRFYCLRLAGLIGQDRYPGNFMSGKIGISKPLASVNLIQLDELTDTIVKIIESNIDSGIYNICSTEHPHRRDYYRELAKKSGNILPSFDETDFTRGKVISSQKIRESLPDIIQKSIYDFP